MRISKFLFLFGAIAMFVGCKAIAVITRQEINYSYVQTQARALSESNYSTPVKLDNTLTSSDYSQITFNSSKSLWMGEKLPFRLELFHLGYVYDIPIALNEFKGDYSQDIRFTNELFNFGTLNQNLVNEARNLTGYAGFRILCELNKPGQYDELVSFLGSKKYRALGRGNIYGIYASPLLTLDSSGKMNVSAFTTFWIGKPDSSNAESVTIYAIANSPDAVCAYEYKVFPGDDTRIKVRCTVYPRKDNLSIGLSPMESLYYFGRNTHHKDIRLYYPQFHYSDALIISRGDDFIYNPLENYNKTVVTDFSSKDIKYFGLIQRDRNYEDYQTPFVGLHMMPNLWVTPDSNWGAGRVVLAENSVNNPNTMNIYTFWVPNAKLQKEKSYSYDYTLHWSLNEPNLPLAQVRSTRVTSNGNNIYFSIAFSGTELSKLPAVTDLTAKLDVKTNAKVSSSTQVLKDPFDNNWRVLITVTLPDKKTALTTPISLSCALLNNGRKVTETWRYKWIP